MRRPSLATIVMLPILAVLLSLASNLAAAMVPDSVRPSSQWVWLAVALLAVLMVGVEIRAARLRGATGAYAEASVLTESDQLDLAAESLAAAVRDQWKAESEIRALNQPEPIRVRWSSTGRPVSADPSVIFGSRWSAQRPQSSGDVTEVDHLLENLPRRQLVVLGAPGSGKTVLALLVTLGMLETRDTGDAVPLLVSLSSWDPTHDHLWNWLSDRVVEDYPGLANVARYGPNAPKRLLSERRVVPILDGLDEIPSELRTDAIAAIDRAISSGTPAVVTCRAQEYEAAVEESGQALTGAAVVEIESLEVDDVVRYLQAGGDVAQRRWRPVLARLRKHPQGPLASALSTPLMAWLARTAYSQPGSDPSELLDSVRFPSQETIENHLLDAFVPSVYADRPTAPGEKPKRPFPPEKAGRFLGLLAHHLEYGGLPRKSKNRSVRGMDARTDFAWWEFYRAVPRLQLTLFVMVGSVPLIAAPVVLIVNATMGFTEDRALAIGMTLAVMIAGIMTYTAVAGPPPPGRVQIGLPKRGELAGMFRRSLRPSLGGALGSGAAGAMGAGISRGFWDGLAAGAAVGALAGLVVMAVALMNGPVDVVRATSPRSLLARDREIAVVTAVAAAICIGAIVALFTFAPYGLAAGVAVIVPGGVGMTSWGWFTLTRCWLFVSMRMPTRLMTFMEDAHQRGVLRQAGAVYQFRHARLRERLAMNLGRVAILEEGGRSSNRSLEDGAHGDGLLAGEHDEVRHE